MKIEKIVAAAALALATACPLYAQQQQGSPAPAAVAPQQPSGDSSVEDPSSEIQALRSRLDKLERQQLQYQKQQDKQKTVEEVVKDAQTHSMLIDGGDFTAGYKDGRFFLGSADGNFVLRPWFHLQFRDVTLYRQDFKKGGTEDQTDNGFEMRRMRFGFDGNVFTPDFTYLFNWATVRASSNVAVKDATGTTLSTISNNIGGTPLLEEAWVKYHFAGTNWSVKAGQIKDPLLHDQIVSSRYQQSTERSLTADLFANGDAFLEGATLIYDPNSWWRAEGGVTHGIRSANTNFLDYPNNGSLNAFNYGAVARGEFKAFGRWKDYAQIGAVDTKEDLLVFGVAADYSERGHSSQIVGVVDGMYANPAGWSVYGAVVDRYTNHNFGVYTQSATGASFASGANNQANENTNEYSGMIQVGYLFDKHWEPYGRFEHIHLQGTPSGTRNSFNAIVGGANYYFVGHRAKITGQVDYLPNGIPIDDGPNDVLASPHGKGEISAEVQFQLLL